MKRDSSPSRKIADILTVSAKWAFSSAAKQRKRAGRHIHVLFCMCDHYEPGTGNVNNEVGTRRVEDLLKLYPRIADVHFDSQGCKPKRTWFFPPHYHKEGWLKKLVSLAELGYGEIELHLHHGKQQSDTSDNLRTTLRRCIEEYSAFGIFGHVGTEKRYGFIHGDWALDNSRYGQYCGVNDEISILKQTGCYADFTFPCSNSANPRQINSIYYAIDDPLRPKSHDKGISVCVSLNHQGNLIHQGLMIVGGPSYPWLKNGRLSGLRIFGDAVDNSQRVTATRIDRWIHTGISVVGREDWIVVKTHTHGASDGDVALGPEMHEMFSYLESTCRDGRGYSLHYVTARELYNIIKAAEAGEAGSDPSVYKDYEIMSPQYDSTPELLEASDVLKSLIAKTYRG
jgi:hypothetical protein